MDFYVSEEGILLVKWYEKKEVISGTNHYFSWYLLVFIMKFFGRK
jgi:hypothetical protein